MVLICRIIKLGQSVFELTKIFPPTIFFKMGWKTKHLTVTKFRINSLKISKRNGTKMWKISILIFIDGKALPVEINNSGEGKGKNYALTVNLDQLETKVENCEERKD